VGLAQDRLGAPGHPDPVLDDRARWWLESTTGLPLKQTSHRAQEIDLLFTLALAAGRRRVTLSWPRLDESTGAIRQPSEPLAREIERLSGTVLPAEDPAGAQGVERSPAARPALVEHRPLLDEHEYDLAALASGRPELFAHLERSDRFQQALAAHTNRWRRAALSDYDGIVGRHTVTASSFTPTSLQDLAACPFRFLLRHALGLQPLDERVEPTPDPRDLGRLAHAVLEELFRPLLGLRAGELPERGQLIGQLEALVEKHRRRLQREGVRGLPVLWRAATQQMRDELARIVSEELARLGETSCRPVDVELSLCGRMSVGATNVEIRGRLDRVDEGTGGIVITDYKWSQGRSFHTAKAGDKRLFAGGRQLQLPLYAWLAFRDDRRPIERVRYVFLRLGARQHALSVDRATLAAREHDLQGLIGELAARVDAGELLAVTDGGERCRSCDFKPLCGPGRVRLERIKSTDARYVAHRSLEQGYP
ncbi:MAG: PD-(D/E)XK nuclease family protein, partial [Acidobacteriota bacterium]